MANPPFPEYVRAEHEDHLRQWIRGVFRSGKLSEANLVTAMTRWIKAKKLTLKPVARGSLERFVHEKNKTDDYRFDVTGVWQFLWECYPQWCPPELSAMTASTHDSDPQISSERHKGITIAGTWEVTFPDNKHPRDITIVIEQDGEKLAGTSRHVKNDRNIPGDDVRMYDLEGRLHQPFVLLNGISHDSSVLAINTWLLQIVLAGQTMTGYVSAYNTDKEHAGIFSLHCRCTRIK